MSREHQRPHPVRSELSPDSERLKDAPYLPLVPAAHLVEVEADHYRQAFELLRLRARLAEVEADRDRYREGLEQIAEHVRSVQAQAICRAVLGRMCEEGL